MMRISIVCLALCLSHALAFPYQIIENEDGEAFALLPVSRVRRQTSGSVDSTGRVTLGHAGTIFKNDNHQLDGSAFASKQFKPNGPPTVGGQLGYSHIPSGSGLNLGASHTRGMGTNVGAQGTYNIINDRRNTLSATGEYSRNYGGQFGTGKPNYGVGLQYQYRF